MTELGFLGEWIMTKGVAPMQEKLKIVREWEPPTSTKDIRSFFGFTNYYRIFVQNYASIASPVTMLTKKDVVWHWDPLQRRVFELLKTSLCIALLLIYPYPSLPYIVLSNTFGMLLEEY